MAVKEKEKMIHRRHIIQGQDIAQQRHTIQGEALPWFISIHFVRIMCRGGRPSPQEEESREEQYDGDDSYRF